LEEAEASVAVEVSEASVVEASEEEEPRGVGNYQLPVKKMQSCHSETAKKRITN
jgi:hypothetical protein